MLLHPDKNPDPKAAELFAELQDSYDALMHPNSSSASSSIPRKEKTAQERSDEARKRYQETLQREKAQEELYFHRLISGWRGKYHRTTMYVSLLLAVFLFSDWIFPGHRKKEILKGNITWDYSQFTSYNAIVETQKNGVLHLADVPQETLYQHPEFYVEKSRFLHIPLNVIHPVEGRLLRYTVSDTLWHFTPLLFFLFLLPPILLVYRKKTAYFTAIYMFSNYLVAPGALAFILVNEHWLHLLTFGFL